MSVVSMKVLAWAGGSLLLAWSGTENAPAPPAEFAAPIRIEAGERHLGAGRMYPSPVLHDVDGDGNADIVVGDLIGRLTVDSAPVRARLKSVTTPLEKLIPGPKRETFVWFYERL